jgi:hypothetical protein
MWNNQGPSGKQGFRAEKPRLNTKKEGSSHACSPFRWARALTATRTDEAEKLLQAGFEYVCTTTENIMLFRKRK